MATQLERLNGERPGMNTKRYSAISFFKQTQLLAPLRTTRQCQALEDCERLSEEALGTGGKPRYVRRLLLGFL
jgi:hypothetical protein